MSKIIKKQVASCDNCYWKYGCGEDHCACEDKEPKGKLCDEYRPECSTCTDSAEYIYQGEGYCSQCIIEKFNVEESTTTYYYLDGRELGSDDDIDEVVRNLSDDIEEIE